MSTNDSRATALVAQPEGSYRSIGCPTSVQIGGILLALAPVLSFGLQYCLSLIEGTTDLLFAHLTVMYVDWIFIPFNFYVVHAIDWRRGGRIYTLTALSLTLNIITHSFWQLRQSEDAGHLISKEHVFLMGGWVHLWFSTLETALIGAYLFVRQEPSKSRAAVKCFLLLYFVGSGICGYIMNRGFMITDVIMVTLGIFFLLVYPQIAAKE